MFCFAAAHVPSPPRQEEEEEEEEKRGEEGFTDISTVAQHSSEQAARLPGPATPSIHPDGRFTDVWARTAGFRSCRSGQFAHRGVGLGGGCLELVLAV